MATTQELLDLTKKVLASPTGQAMSNQDRASLGLNAITSQDIKPAEPIKFATPQTSTPYDVSKLNSTYQLSEPEKKAQSLTTDLQDLNKMLEGESTYRSSVESQYKLPELTQTQQDLQTRLKQLQNEAQAIPLQAQQDASGRGITAGGLAPIEMAKKRTNAIDALTVSSLLEASRGNITTATSLIDRAVAEKFDPIRASIKAKQDNYNLIINSPEFTLAEKKRATELSNLQKEQERAIQKQEDDEKSINTMLITAMQNGIDSATLKKMSVAKNPTEALMIASEAGYAGEKNNLIFQKIQTKDAFGNNIEKIVAYDPKTGKQVGLDGQETTQEPSKINVFGIKATSTTKGYGGVDSGIGASDGGTFLSSQGIEKDKEIAKKLLTSSIYANLTLDQALKKWSNKGYGAEVVTGVDPQAKIKDLSPTQIDSVLNGIMKREGIATSPTLDTNNLNAKNWAKLVQAGTVKLENVPSNQRNQVVNELANNNIISKADATTTNNIQQKIKLVDDIKETMQKFGANAVGPNILGRFDFASMFTGGKQELIGQVEQLVSQGTMDALLNLKKAGGTLGALSEGEKDMLRSSFSKIGTWSIKDKTGKVVGYKISESAFKKELENIRTLAEKALKESGGESGVVNSLEQYLANNPQKVTEYNTFVRQYPNLTSEDYLQLLGQ